MFEIKVNIKTATEDFDKWLDRKQVSPKERETKKDIIEQLVSEITYGNLTIDENGVINQKLKFPLEAISDLNYKSRLTGVELNAKLKGAAMDMTMFSAYGAALTDQPIGVINKLDTEDAKIMRAIAGFFM